MWEYCDLPEALRLPPCPRCTNHGRITQFAQCAYFCGDCGHAYAAFWRDEPRAVTATSGSRLPEARTTGARMGAS